MVEVTKPDYLSLVNKGGSGFNISELVTSMVASEIEPKRILQNTKLEKVENAISGIGYLYSQAKTTQANFSTLQNDSYFELSSSNSSGVAIKTTDETKIQNGNRTIANVEIAKTMIFELGGFTDLTTTYTADIDIDFGTWIKHDPESVAETTSYYAGKTYKVTSTIPAGAGNAADLNNDTDWTGGELSVGEIFKVNDGVVPGGIDTGGFIELETYSFTDQDVSSVESVSFVGETLTQIAARFNAISGISARIIDTLGDGTNYSLVLSSDVVGAKNGFKLTETTPGGDGRWETPTVPEADGYSNNFSQLAKDASFNLDGISVSRSSNSITDLIDGVEIELKSDFTAAAVLRTSRSDAAILQSVNDIIFSLNEFKSEIDRLTFIDVEGDANGPLAMETSALMLKSNFKKLAVEPLSGFGSQPIYLSQLGIKTNSKNEYYLDQTTFEKTLSTNPEFFMALKDENLSSSVQSATVSKSQFTRIPAGTYTVEFADGAWKFGDTTLTQIDLDNGGSRFTSVSYPGLVIDTADRSPSSFNIYVGKSLSEKIGDLMEETLDLNSSVSSAEESYKNLTLDIEERLDKLSEREKLISSRYTEQFGAMENSMTQFNSTKSLLENFIEAWKKQK